MFVHFASTKTFVFENEKPGCAPKTEEQEAMLLIFGVSFCGIVLGC
jgi:hypothetical protein